jgi:cell division protein FtsQ
MTLWPVPPEMRWRVPLVALGVLIAVSAPWWGGHILRGMAFFRVRAVEVDGAQYLAPRDVVARLALDSTATVWDDSRPLANRLRALPQVRSVTITRKLPATLIVTMVEQPPVALVSVPGGLRVYDGRGKVLPIDPTRVDLDLPIASGPDAGILRMLDAARRRLPALYARISGVRRSSAGDLVITLLDMRVLAPNNVDTDRLGQVLPVMADLARRHARADELDLRYRDQVVARLQ